MPQSIFTDEEQEREREEEPVVMMDYEADSDEEAARRGAMAWSVGIVFFSSIVFMLLIGWIADLVLGSSPWGIVGGIVLGSIIGFIQFFRISSRIFNPNKNSPAVRPLMPHDDESDSHKDPNSFL